uniref:G-protein coupled receptors family 1 profile domain-containing protein n=1 Tax=Acrobeloides nanus TaxID=290746 RepID=A0A914EQ89_9BILA
MSMISLDRYMGISRPLKTRNKSRGVVVLKIALVWVITLVISSPLAVLALTNHANILHDNLCAITNQYYMFYGSTTAFLIPFFIMLITYVKTTHLLNKQADLLGQKSTDRFHNGLRRTMPQASHRKLGYTRTCSYNMSNGPPAHKASTMSYSSAGNTPGNGHAQSASLSKLRENNSSTDSEDMQLAEKKESAQSTTFANELRKGSSALRLQFGKLQKRTTSLLTNITTRVARKNSLQSANTELANEHKATRVLAVVFICFFICWTPFFIMNFTLAFCGESCAVPPWVGSVFLWLGYISSTINPIIYTIFNRRFRQAFLRILRCQCMHSIREYSLTYSRHTFVQGDTHTYSNFDKSGSATTGREHANGRIFTPPSCRQGSRMVGMLISAGLQPVVPTTGASAKIEARSLPSSRHDSPEEPDETEGYTSEWSTPILSKRKRSLLPQIRTRPAVLPASSILSAATAMLQMPMNPNPRRASEGVMIAAPSQATKGSGSTTSSPGSPVRKRSLNLPTTVQFDVPFVDANNIELMRNGVCGNMQTSQISDYDNLHEINPKCAAIAGTSTSVSEEENSESNENRPLLKKESVKSKCSIPKFSIQHTKPPILNSTKQPIKWPTRTVPYPNITSARYKPTQYRSVIKSFTVTEELAKSADCRICERPHSSAGIHREDEGEKLLSPKIIEDEQPAFFFQNTIFLKETYL